MVHSVLGTLLAWYKGAKKPVVRDSCDNDLHKIHGYYILFTFETSFGDAMKKCFFSHSLVLYATIE